MFNIKELSKMNENLWRVSMKHKETGEKVDLMVWAETNEAATHKIVNAIGGYKGEYSWRGTSPIYKNNELVTR